MDPGQDLLLAALSESGISPNDLFDISAIDMAQPTNVQQVLNLSYTAIGQISCTAVAPLFGVSMTVFI